MTDDDKSLVERLRGDWPEILVEKHWMMDSDAIDKQREEAADRIEALSADNERLLDIDEVKAKVIDSLLNDLASAEQESERLREALVQIAKPCSVVVEPSGKAGECWKKMYYGWRKIAVDRVDIARAALGEAK